MIRIAAYSPKTNIAFLGNSENKAKSAPIHINYGVHDVKPVAKNPMSKGLLHKLGRFIAGTAFAGVALTSCQPGYDLDLDDAMIKTPVNPKDTTEVVDTIKSAQPEYTIEEIYNNQADSLGIIDKEHRGQNLIKTKSYSDMTGTITEIEKDLQRSSLDSTVLKNIEYIPNVPNYKGYSVSVLKKVSNNAYDEYIYSSDATFKLNPSKQMNIIRHELKTAKEGRLEYIDGGVSSRVYNVAKDSLVDESAFSGVKTGIKILSREYAVSTGLPNIRMNAASSDAALKNACKSAAKTVVNSALKNVR